LDLKGKVAVLLYGGSPSEIPGPLSAHYNDIRQRWAALKKAGAIGITAILNPHSMDIPWERVKMLRTQVGMVPADETLDDTAGIELGVAFNPASADKLFAGSGHTFHKISDLAKARKSLPRFPLKVEIRARAKMDVQHLESSNVVAKLEGSDPKLRNDCVVMSAHIDSATTHQSLSALVYQVVTNVITRRQTTRISLSTWKQPVSSRALFGTYSPLLLIARRLLTGSRIASSSALFSISVHGR